MNQEQKSSKIWDVIVIGTGMGGATAGYALAKKGLSVLFLEKGGSVKPGQDLETAKTPESRLQQGWWPQPLSQSKQDDNCNPIFAAIGCGLGGSSMHYAAALERMPSSDFDALQTPKQLVSAWPVSYADFLPYYAEAETLYGLNNNADDKENLRLSDWDKALLETMRKAGLKPERLNVGIKYDKDCTECIGKVCHRDCKSDSRVACLNKALNLHNCELLDHCDVQSLEADANQIHFVHAIYKGDAIKLSAKKFVLAAGAVHSPQLLLQSANETWPNGLANSSDQVGRNLMFHGTEIYAIWAPKKFNRIGLQKKSLSIRDFYVHSGRRLGYIQSMGLDAGRGNIAGFIKDFLRRHGLRHERLLSLIAKVPSHVVAWVLGDASIFAAMVEDDPDPSNRIQLNARQPNGAMFTYTITAEMRERANALYKVFAKHVTSWRVIRITPALDINTGHPCGTCRFGNDPETSVLDTNCRSHDVKNLYVVDSSFMPRSGAINPSLTIAANALRVAEKIAQAI